MTQLSLFSADLTPPVGDDLGGLLAANGRLETAADGVRLEIRLPDPWRARALVRECRVRDVEAHIQVDDQVTVLRTDPAPALAELSAHWLDGSIKVVPREVELSAGLMRCWAIAAGRPAPVGYLLGLDPQSAGHPRSPGRLVRRDRAGRLAHRPAGRRSGDADRRPAAVYPAGRHGRHAAPRGADRSVPPARAPLEPFSHERGDWLSVSDGAARLCRRRRDGSDGRPDDPPGRFPHGALARLWHPAPGEAATRDTAPARVVAGPPQQHRPPDSVATPSRVDAQNQQGERDLMATGTTASTRNGGVRLVVVESPARRRPSAGYLGDGYIVESSVGHIRDLPAQRRRRPGQVQGRAVGPARGRTPRTTSSRSTSSRPEKKAQVAKLKSLLAGADELYLATDEDREGEAIAWHLLETLKPKVPVKRMVFHEITPAAIREAAAQPARAGRQPGRRPGDPPHPGPAVRLRGVAGAVEEGHAEAVRRPGAVGGHPDHRAAGTGQRMAFRSGTYWGIDALLAPDAGADSQLHRRAELRRRSPARRRAGLRRGHRRPQERTPTCCCWTRTAPAPSPRRCRTAPRRSRSVEEKPYTRRPYPPFMTSTLQQEAGRKLGFSSERTMRTAQRLYESGYITYMRTDSTTLGQTALDAARSQARELYGAGVRAGGPAAVHPQGQERAGGARGHPAGGGELPHARAGGQRHGRRRVPALRADLAAHHRLPDGRRARA